MTVQQQLLDIVSKINRPGTFCASGPLPAILPGLEVADVGPVALPFDKRQAAAIKQHARQAPYGKGTQTLVDTEVRRVWEIDAAQVVLANPEWRDVLQKAVDTVQSELGLEKQKLEAHLYKLLLYEPGSFFLAHRDSEKLDRMVATLVIALPSAHEGGELAVRHEGREMVVDFSRKSPFQTQFAAFYADCEHEILPVTSGFRLALVYNLTLARSKRGITAPTSREQITAAAHFLQQWAGRASSDSSAVSVASKRAVIPDQQITAASRLLRERAGRRRPSPDSGAVSAASKLAVILEHQYSQAGLTRDALKGVDRARADVLFAAVREAGCDASLALVTYWESGAAEPSGDYGYGYGRHRRYSRYDDDLDEEVGGEHVMGEVFESSLTAEHFSDAQGNPLAFGDIPLDEDELVSKEPLNKGLPDKEDFEGYTGNAGMTLDRWYHRAAVVLWPAASRFDVLCEAGMKAAVGGLAQMVRQWKQTKKGEQEVLKQSCIDFAGRIIAHWPERPSASGYFADYRPLGSPAFDEEDLDEDDERDFDEEDNVDLDGMDESAGTQPRSQPHSLLPLLEELGDASLIAAWIRGVLAKDVSVDPGTILGDVCKQHGWSTFQHELRKLFENSSHETLERHACLLADFSLRKDKNADRRRLCAQLARQLVTAVERWDPKRAKRNWRARTIDLRALLASLSQAFLALEESKLLERLVKYLRDRPKEFNLTTVQVPALLGLETWLKRNVKSAAAPLHHWLKAVAEELEHRKAHPPREPKDWRRASATGCTCADCKELARFLNDPNVKTLRLPLAKHRRQHLHNVIDGKKLDTTHVTERSGSPYTLVCTKTGRSYERSLQAHRIDLSHLTKIRKLLDWHEKLQ